MTPQEFIAKTGLSYERIAQIVGVEYNTVCKWFARSPKTHRNPSKSVLMCLHLYYEKEYLRGEDTK